MRQRLQTESTRTKTTQYGSITAHGIAVAFQLES